MFVKIGNFWDGGRYLIGGPAKNLAEAAEENSDKKFWPVTAAALLGCRSNKLLLTSSFW